jgi:hypothetical protein
MPESTPSREQDESLDLIRSRLILQHGNLVADWRSQTWVENQTFVFAGGAQVVVSRELPSGAWRVTRDTTQPTDQPSPKRPSNWPAAFTPNMP